MMTPVHPAQIGRALWSGLLSCILYFSGFFVFWTPLPLFHLGTRVPRVCWWLGTAAAVGLLFLVSFLVPARAFEIRFAGAAYFLYYLLIAFFLTLGVWNRWSLLRLGAMTALSVTALVFWTGYGLDFLGWVDVKGMLVSMMQETYQVLDKLVHEDPPNSNRVEMLTFIAQAKQWMEFLPRLLPSLVFVFTLLIVTLNIGFLNLVYHVRKAQKLGWDFRRLQIPSGCLWALIAAGSLFFLDVYAFKWGWPKIIAANLLVASAFVYFIQGLGILAFFLGRYSLLFRFAIYGLLLLFFQMLSWVVFGLGLADAWFDFRRLQKKIR